MIEGFLLTFDLSVAICIGYLLAMKSAKKKYQGKSMPIEEAENGDYKVLNILARDPYDLLAIVRVENMENSHQKFIFEVKNFPEDKEDLVITVINGQVSFFSAEFIPDHLIINAPK